MHSLKYKKLSEKEQERLFVDLAKSMALLRGPEEVAEFLKDLLSEVEIFMLARRIQIAELLLEGFTYERIIKTMKVSRNTISRVQTWLDLYGDGYRNLVKRREKTAGRQDQEQTFSKLKRKYPSYFWPELLLEEIMRAASKREKQRMQNVLARLKNKTKLSRQLSQILKSN